jgi:thymidylate kinase
MTNIIIFEGVDNCGKTNISQALVERHLPDYQYFKVKQEAIHIEHVPKEILKEAHALQLNFFYELARQVDFNVVVDRFYPSEYVYGSLFREIDEDLIWDFDAKFAALGTKLVILTKEDDQLEDPLWTREQLIQIKAKYVEFAKKTACHVLVLPTDSENLDEQLPIINEFLNN